MDLILNNPAESLITLGIFLLIIEVAVLGFSTFILFFFGCAAIVSGLMVLTGILPPELMPIVLSVGILSLLFAGALWQPLKKFQNHEDTHQVKNDFIGLEFVVSETIDSSSNYKTKLSGVEWQVKSELNIPSGSKVAVTKAEVGVLWVEKA